MHKIFKLLIHYICIFLGLIITSWIIWSRFIRERTIRDIPDELFNEYRFWILLYICFIYIFVIKNLIKPSNIIPGYKEIINAIYKPLTLLDHAIKYNQFLKSYYYTFMQNLLILVKPSNIDDDRLKILMFFLQIFPRIILVSFLTLDTFYFSRLEVFYKIILLAGFPFLFRYFKYSCKDIYEHWILDLEENYDYVRIYEKGYEFDDLRIKNTQAFLHNEKKTIKEYIEIKWENMFEYLLDNVDYIYEATPLAKNKTYDEYLMKKYNTTTVFFTLEDIKAIRLLYHTYMPNILDMKLYLFRLDAISETFFIKWSKIIIFSLYFICWSYILLKSYWHYPIELNMSKAFILNITQYLCEYNNPFTG